MSAGFDRNISVFSPDGRLYQVEYAFKAITNSTNTCLGINSDNSCVLITQKKVPSKLMDPSTVTSMYKLDAHIGCCISGLIPDGRLMVARAREEAASFSYEFGYPIPVELLVKKIANMNQMGTQYAGMRLPGAALLVIGYDGDGNQELFKVDPAGHYAKFKAVSSGNKQHEALNNLEKLFAAKKPVVALDASLTSFMTVIGAELKPKEIELALLKDGKFVILKENEVDLHMTRVLDQE